MKNFKLTAAQIKPLAEGYGGCLATDRITVDGAKVGFMQRDEPHNPADSGWQFTAGDESDAYMEDGDNHLVYDVNTIANYDPEIIPFLDAPIGTALMRDENGAFIEIDYELEE